MSTTGIFWFTNDLRLHDQRALLEASQNLEALACVYVLDPRYHLIYSPTNSGLNNMTEAEPEKSATQKLKVRMPERQKTKWGEDNSRFFSYSKQRFLYESLTCLEKSLSDLNQELLILSGPPEDSIADLILSINATQIYRSTNAGYNENLSWHTLKSNVAKSQNNRGQKQSAFIEIDTHTLLNRTDLTFSLPDLPDSFSKFRKIAETLEIEKPLKRIDWLPMPPAHLPASVPLNQNEFDTDTKLAIADGGEQAALLHLETYFCSKKDSLISGNNKNADFKVTEQDNLANPSIYKETRNELDGWANSTKFSFWLASGSLSVKKIIASLKYYEKSVIKNKSTYWIYFELLWREYFQWYAHKYKQKLFIKEGIKTLKPLTSFYSERYQRWCSGSTSYPLINALMKQLNVTGYMSNRGRQIVASCFVHELQLDWRYGAAYFERQLIDYDVAANWGNWQYLAGVGADPRGHRHFDIQKQTLQYDSTREFIDKWVGSDALHTNDSVDAADWPIVPPNTVHKDE